jgi:anaerobic magnesium-protoporphyrin IX monomethyl ester cyclase
MTTEMATILANTGCIDDGFGAESGSQKILNAFNKRTTVRQNMELLKICNEQHIKVKAFLMLGLLGETQETVAETAEFLEFLMTQTFVNIASKKITNKFDLGIYFPYKGTAIRDTIDNSSNTNDLFLEHNPDLYKGVYKGKHGVTEAYRQDHRAFFRGDPFVAGATI